MLMLMLYNFIRFIRHLFVTGAALFRLAMVVRNVSVFIVPLRWAEC